MTGFQCKSCEGEINICSICSPEHWKTHHEIQLSSEEAELLALTGNEEKWIMAIETDEQGQEWELVMICPDSGAAESVAPKSTALSVVMEESEGSRRGQEWTAANGTKIFNEGQKTIEGIPEGWLGEGACSLTMQCGKVTKPLGAVIQMVKAGNKVVFDEVNGSIQDGSYIENKKTGKTITIMEHGGTFGFKIWLKKGNKTKEKNTTQPMQIGNDNSTKNQRQDLDHLDNWM
jgi:hypothetical protein